jgi:hypothetical protein
MSWSLSLEFDRSDTRFPAGAPVTGKLHVVVGEKTEHRGVHLRWICTVRAASGVLDFRPETSVLHDEILTEEVTYPGSLLELPFSFAAPTEPLSYEGIEIRVEHRLEASVDLALSHDPSELVEATLVPAEERADRLDWPAQPVRLEDKAKGDLRVRLAVGLLLIVLGATVPVGWTALNAIAFFVGLWFAGEGFGVFTGRTKLGTVRLLMNSEVVSPGELVPVEVVCTPTRTLDDIEMAVTLQGVEQRLVTTSGGKRQKVVERFFHEEAFSLQGPRSAAASRPSKWAGAVQVPRIIAWTLRHGALSRFGVEWRLHLSIRASGVRFSMTQELRVAPLAHRAPSAEDTLASEEVPSAAAHPVTADQWARLKPKRRRRNTVPRVLLAVFGGMIVLGLWAEWANYESGADRGGTDPAEVPTSQARLLMVRVDERGVGLAHQGGLFLSEHLFDARSEATPESLGPWEAFSSALDPYETVLQDELRQGLAQGFPPPAVEGMVAGRRPPARDDSNVASWCWQPARGGGGLIGCFGLYGPRGGVWPFDDPEGPVVDARWLNDSTAVVVQELPGGNVGAARITVVTVQGTVLWQTQPELRGNHFGWGPVVNHHDWPGGIAVHDGSSRVVLISAGAPLTVDTVHVDPGGAVWSEVELPPSGVIHFVQTDPERALWLAPDGTEVSGGLPVYAEKHPPDPDLPEPPPGPPTLSGILRRNGEAVAAYRVTSHDGSDEPFQIAYLTFRGDTVRRIWAGHRYHVFLQTGSQEVREFTMTREALLRAGVRSFDGRTPEAPRPVNFFPESGSVVFDGAFFPDFEEPSSDIFAVDGSGEPLTTGSATGCGGWETSRDGRYVLLGCGDLWDLAGRGATRSLAPEGERVLAAHLLGSDRAFVVVDREAPAENALVVTLEGAPAGAFRAEVVRTDFEMGEAYVRVYFRGVGSPLVIVERLGCQEIPGVFLLREDGVPRELDEVIQVEEWPPSGDSGVQDPDSLWPISGLWFDADCVDPKPSWAFDLRVDVLRNRGYLVVARPGPNSGISGD